jgi:DNA-binding CsgD family transcriptional regulator
LTLTANPLTEQERRALALAAQGYTDTIAARMYGASRRTHQRHIASAQAKLGARSRIHAVAIAVALRIITVPLPGGRP